MTDIYDFMRSVAAATNQGQIPWEVEDERAYVARGSSGALRVMQGPSDADPVRLQVLNTDAQVIESLVTEPQRPGQWRSWEQTLNSLYIAAGQQAKGVTEVVEDLSKEFGLKPVPLEDDIPF
jgi:hypothetical protein